MLSEIDTLVLTDKGFKLVNDLAADDNLTTIVNGTLTYEPWFRVVDKPACKDIVVYDSNKNFATSSLSYCKFYNDNLNSPNNAYTLREVIEELGLEKIKDEKTAGGITYGEFYSDKDNYLISSLVGSKIIQMSNSSVWFTICNHYGEYFIGIYYDNLVNKPNGEDL